MFLIVIKHLSTRLVHLSALSANSKHPLLWYIFWWASVLFMTQMKPITFQHISVVTCCPERALKDYSVFWSIYCSWKGIMRHTKWPFINWFNLNHSKSWDGPTFRTSNPLIVTPQFLCVGHYNVSQWDTVLGKTASDHCMVNWGQGIPIPTFFYQEVAAEIQMNATSVCKSKATAWIDALTWAQAAEVN